MAADETRVDAADVLARDGRSHESCAHFAIEALREAAGGGWVCIAPDGTLYTSRHTDVAQWTPDVLAMLRPVVGP